MKYLKIILLLASASATLLLSGCVHNDTYVDDEEYSSMPWATPETWEAAPSLPGMSPGY
ncbi:MAG: hypothetical protein JXR25_01965 [Pontiellaceae bacterium]|nr:hypothetical protein [Pontiellaceae bacterium]MBN2783565.1 hypothetical protein [Pontiellaceae bacterium]